MSLRLLLANVTLAGRTGTEIVVRDLAHGLHGRGHHVAVYAPARGPIADELEAGGIRVVTRIDDVGAPDIVHGHHFIETVEALQRFPQARGIFVCHDRTSPFSIPPAGWPAVQRFVAVDQNCLERLRDDWFIPPSQTRVILNAVDLSRFAARPPLPEKPLRALVFSHPSSPGTHVPTVRAACQRLGISLDVIGAGEVTDAPETRLGNYDLVFAKARCAIEALAVGAAVVLCDAAGSGPMVTPDDVAQLRQWNFGVRTLTHPLDVDRFVHQIQRYDAEQAAAVSAIIRRDASLDAALDQYEDVYREAMQLPVAADRSVTPLFQALLRRTGQLEHDIRKFEAGECMPALSDEDISNIRVEIERAPQTMVAGVPASVNLRIRNEMTAALGTWPPFPVQVACRWKLLDAPRFEPDQDAARTPLYKGISPGATQSIFIRVSPPSRPGRYVLRVALVQEYKRWLDQVPNPACAEVTVNVTGQTLLTNLKRTPGVFSG